MAALVVSLDGGEPAVFEEQFTIGQGEICGLRLTDGYASTVHARCAPRADGWTVEDMGSTNGTWLLDGTAQGLRVYGPRLIAKGDRVKIGKTVITLVPA